MKKATCSSASILLVEDAQMLETARKNQWRYSVLGLQKHFWGDGASFSRIRKRGMVINYGGMVCAKMFHGGMVLFSRGRSSSRISLNASTAQVQ